MNADADADANALGGDAADHTDHAARADRRSGIPAEIEPDPAAASLVEQLTEDACWDLLRSSDLGRLAVATDSGVDVFPMNYVVRDQAIFLRSAPGSKMIDITERPSVAYEADGTAEGLRWSVVVKGTARRLGSDSDIEASGVLELESESPTAKWNYIRIDPASVTGRRFRGRSRAT
ncbi:pyridoxamine 5'-phosphate oxidase family protein [Planctomonas psychrotolerans]|uniref:pyridoxamine 5'-phosphate oxidase family protein n=1 Tax=Planctomonas psychrotolerans TaxID=2528712 RepID=UPI00123C2E10|nr:pyridoxamine 5'-phosphate oxidase family protein [Planctomonas psychrotolerans]